MFCFCFLFLASQSLCMEFVNNFTNLLLLHLCTSLFKGTSSLTLIRYLAWNISHSVDDMPIWLYVIYTPISLYDLPFDWFNSTRYEKIVVSLGIKHPVWILSKLNVRLCYICQDYFYWVFIEDFILLVGEWNIELENKFQLHFVLKVLVKGAYSLVANPK